VARLLAKALNCAEGPTPEPDNTCNSCKEITSGHSPDVFEIDGASNTGVDDVRSLRENSRYLPAGSRFKIYIIDEVHMLSTSAFNALLKTLEEPPEHVKFIFATTEPHKIPLTVLSRCQRFDFKRIPSDVILKRLRMILESEGSTIEEEGLLLIAREAAGSMRDALSLTDQVLAFGGESITAEQVYGALGLARSSMFEKVISCVIGNQVDELMLLVEELFDEGHDLKRFLEGLLWHVRHLILYRTLENPDSLVDALEEDRARFREQAAQAETLRWHQAFDVLSRALGDLPRSPYPRLVLETALLRLSAVEPLLDVGDLVERVERLSMQNVPEGSGRPAPGRPPPQGSSGGGESRPRFVPPTARAKESKPETKSEPETKSKPKEEEQPIPRVVDEPRVEERTEQQDGTFPAGWEELVARVSKHRPSLGSILNHACPLEVSPRYVRIALEPGTFFADQMKAPRNRREIEKFCRDMFGEETELKVEDRQEGQGVSLAQSWEQERKKSADEQRKQAINHPMVKEAIKVFGAEVEQIRTPERSES
jgi:DNA polymerase III subunit gamma/tau